MQTTCQLSQQRIAQLYPFPSKINISAHYLKYVGITTVTSAFGVQQLALQLF